MKDGTITAGNGSGGDPNGFVTITDVSLISNGLTPGSVSLSAGFVCGERISAGQFTVPAWITSAMPIPGADNDS